MENHSGPEKAAPLELRENRVVGVFDITIILPDHPGETTVNIIIQILHVLLEAAGVERPAVLIASNG